MKKVLKIDSEGNMEFDNVSYQKNNITGKLLEEIFSESLKNNVEFIIDETDFISHLFIRIKNESSTDSILNTDLNVHRDKYLEQNEKKRKIESANSEDDFPF